jgi:Replication-relaxation
MAGRRRRLPTRRGPQITDRDIDILGWIGRHGVVTPAQVARHFFTREQGEVGQWAAYRRLRKLEELGLIRQDRTFWREANVLRLTGAGARLADIDVGPARLVLAEVRHTLAVVDLVESLLANSPKGTTVRTERELRIERRRALSGGTRKPGRGRVPDALFIHPRGMQVAIELDITPKRTRDLERILIAYLQERYDKIVWYVLPRQVDRLKEIVRKQRADDVVEVRAWHGSDTSGKTSHRDNLSRSEG